MIRQFSLLIAISCTCLFLASCATTKDLPVSKTVEVKKKDTWPAEKQARKQIKIWEIRGRLGVQTATTGGTMDIIWKQSEEEFSIRLIAPLGAGTYLIQGNNNYAEIRFPDGNKKMISDIDEIFSSTLEVDLPVTAINDWVRGLPAEDLSVDKVSWNKKKLIHRLKQEGWNVELTKYAGTKTLMPHAIYLSRDDDAELDIRLILRQWLIDN